ncbi:MAG: ATP-binding protein [Gammaproteobacteria bacterium]|nr:ATP-binding protein [Gammaproteobacteria bacterium]
MTDNHVIKFAFLGAPSTGKTSLCKALAEKYDTVWMPEYGREYWMEHQQERRLSPEQLVEIAEGHIEREDRLVAEAHRYLFVDTEAITTYHFAIDYHGEAHPRLQELAEEAEKRYEVFFLCAADIPYDDTWERSGEQHRAEFQARLCEDLINRRVPFTAVKGTLEQRVERVTSMLDDYTPI